MMTLLPFGNSYMRHGGRTPGGGKSPPDIAKGVGGSTPQPIFAYSAEEILRALIFHSEGYGRLKLSTKVQHAGV